MYDFGSDIDSLNGRAVLGLIYKNRSESGTPTGTKLDFIGRQFKQPKEGIGYDNSPTSHMWRTIMFPDRPL